MYNNRYDIISYKREDILLEIENLNLPVYLLDLLSIIFHQIINNLIL